MIDILDDSYESDLTDEEHEQLILMSEHAIAPPLSPGAQAVLDTTYNTFDLQDSFSLRKTVAAALRAAADHVVPEKLTSFDIYYELLRIADELEAQ